MPAVNAVHVGNVQRSIVFLAGETRPALDWRYDAILAGMVGKGLGLQHISTYLAVEASVVLERIVALDLATPHDSPMRRCSHPRAWPLSDFRRLIDCWLENWDRTSTAEVFGRSVGSVSSQARRLGLPCRQRSSTRHPGLAAIEWLKGVRAAAPDVATPWALPFLQPAADKNLLTLVRRVDGSILRIERQQSRNEVKWSLPLDLEVSERAWAGQHYVAMATELGISKRALSHRLYVLGLPARERAALVREYDPRRAETSVVRKRYKWRRCSFNPEVFFWSSGPGDTLSRISERSRRYQALA